MRLDVKDLHPEYQGLIEDLGPATEARLLSDDDLEYCKDRLPPHLLEFLAYSGAATYFKGAVTVCNPREFAPVLALVFKADGELHHRDCTVVSYSAFGELAVWSNLHGIIGINLPEGEVSSVRLAPPEFDARMMPKPKKTVDPNIVAAGTVIDDPSEADFFDLLGREMFKACVKMHGAPQLGECFGFFPALGLAGLENPMRRVENIQRVSALEHFSQLAQMQPFYLTKLSRSGLERVREIG